MSTLIEWTDETWNPLIGCSRCSPGCDNCYAVSVVHRGMSPQHIGLTIKRDGEPTDWTGEVREVPHKLDEPLRWKKPRRIFVNSLSDLFHAEVSDQFIRSVFDVMAKAPQHTFQILTKRPQRMADFTATFDPLPNVWLGTSIESDRYAFRADHLRRTRAAVRWISAEPLLGPLPSLNLTGIDWMVVGGESGPGARPMHAEWARDLRERCAARTAGDWGSGAPDPVAFLFKQWGAWAPDIDVATSLDADESMSLVGKKAAGRVFDGRTWDGYPS